MDETITLLRAAQSGDRDAAGRMIEANAGLIWSVARRYFGRGVEPDDLYQLGCLGFLKAIDGFDESYGTGEIRRFLRDDGAVKVSRGIKERAMALRTARKALEQDLGRDPTVSELSAATGLSPEDIAVAETATVPMESLQQPAGEDGFSLEQVLGDWTVEERLVEHVALRQAIEQLPEKERQVVFLRFYHGMTQDRASRVLGVSQVQVSRLERRAVRQLRALLE